MSIAIGSTPACADCRHWTCLKTGREGRAIGECGLDKSATSALWQCTSFKRVDLDPQIAGEKPLTFSDFFTAGSTFNPPKIESKPKQEVLMDMPIQIAPKKAAQPRKKGVVKLGIDVDLFRHIYEGGKKPETTEGKPESKPQAETAETITVDETYPDIAIPQVDIPLEPVNPIVTYNRYGTTRERILKQIPLKGYQEEAIRHMEVSGVPYGAFFMSPGLGKSATVLQLLSRHSHYTMVPGVSMQGYAGGEPIQKVLLIAPNGVHLQWVREQMPMWLSVPYRVWLLGNSAEPVVRQFGGLEKSPGLDIYVCNIDIFSQRESKWVDELYRVFSPQTSKTSMLILDESSMVKTPTASRTQNVYKITSAFHYRYILTGTPLTNSLVDVWAQYAMLDRGIFNCSFRQFQNRVQYTGSIHTGKGMRNGVSIDYKRWKLIRACKTYTDAYLRYRVSPDTYAAIVSQKEYTGADNAAEVIKVSKQVAPFTFTRRLEDCVAMRGKQTIIRTVEMTPQQAKAYATMQKDMYAQFEGCEVTAANKMTVILRLQQLSAGYVPQSIDNPDMAEQVKGKWFPEPPKIEMLLADTSDATPDNPIIVGTSFSMCAERLYNEYVKMYGEDQVVLFTGFRKEGSIDEFKAGLKSVLVCNIKAAAKGFNLQHAHRTYIYDLTWSMEDVTQFEGRTYRLGQNEVCQFYWYLTNNSVDGLLYNAVKNKAGLAQLFSDVSLEDIVFKGVQTADQFIDNSKVYTDETIESPELESIPDYWYRVPGVIKDSTLLDGFNPDMRNHLLVYGIETLKKYAETQITGKNDLTVWHFIAYRLGVFQKAAVNPTQIRYAAVRKI